MMSELYAATGPRFVGVLVGMLTVKKQAWSFMGLGSSKFGRVMLKNPLRSMVVELK